MQLLRRNKGQPAEGQGSKDPTSLASSLQVPPEVDDTLKTRLKIVMLHFMKTAMSPQVAMLAPLFLKKLSASHSSELRPHVADIANAIEWALDAPDEPADYEPAGASADDDANPGGDAGPVAGDAEAR